MKLNRTTLRTVEMLKLVLKKSDGITLDEICAKLNTSKINAYDIMTTLVQVGMIHVAREQKQRYTIGLTAYRTGTNHTNNLDFISTIDPVLKAFPKEVGRTVFFGIRSDDSIAYTRKSEPGNLIITTATVGTKNPIYCTSPGKAIMAYTKDEDRDGVLSRISFKKYTDRTICTREELEREFESMWEKGCAFDARKPEEHMERVGALVFGQDSDVMGAISISSPHKPTEDHDALGRLVSDKGVQLSCLLGYIRHI